jgi:sRNA-binding protein
LERSRLARGGFDPTDARFRTPAEPRKLASFVRTDFAVGREYDDGRFEPLHIGLTRDTAESLAGRKRDGSTDTEVALQLREHWTWGYRQTRGSTKNGQKRVPFVPQRRGRVNHAMGQPGFAGMTPEKRREVSARANAARLNKVSAERRSQIAREANAARYGK